MSMGIVEKSNKYNNISIGQEVIKNRSKIF